MQDGNNSVETAKPTTISYSQADVWIDGVEVGASNQYNTARNWLDGVYAIKNGEDYEWKDEKQTIIKYPVFAGTTYSMNYISHNDAFLLAKEISSNTGNPYGLPVSAESHLMKDSEWGAVAYLAQSKYGLENNEICINNINLNSGGVLRTEETGKSGVDSVYAVTGLTSKAVVDKSSEDQNVVGTDSRRSDKSNK